MIFLIGVWGGGVVIFLHVQTIFVLFVYNAIKGKFKISQTIHKFGGFWRFFLFKAQGTHQYSHGFLNLSWKYFG